MAGFLSKVRKTIEKHEMIASGDRIGVALSGGADSVALLYALRFIGIDYGASLFIIHVNHGLRGDESDRDELFIKRLGENLHLAFDSRHISIPNIRQQKRGSIEDIARDERYRCFEEIKNRRGLTKIALGHTLGDQVETVLMKVLRGSGLSGLRGILPVRDNVYIRPLIETTRAEIVEFLHEQHVDYVFDSSNEDESYLRNRVRRKLLPELLESYNPQLFRTIGQMVDVLRLEDEYFSVKVEEILTEWNLPDGKIPVVLSVNKFKGSHEALQRRIIRRLIGSVSKAKHEVEYRQVKAVIDFLVGGKPQGMVHIGGNVRVRREYDALFFETESDGGRTAEKAAEEMLPRFYYSLQIPSVIALDEISRSISCEIVDSAAVNFSMPTCAFMDCDTLEFPLHVRNVKPGDIIQPLGMKGTKKVKEIFIDAKIPRWRRRQIPVIEDGKSIVWIGGICLSERVRVTSGTKKILKAEII